MSKIGVFAGTFNPIHEGHISFLRQVKKQLELNKVFLMVCKNAMHKATNLAPYNHRTNMCRLAVREFSNVEVSNLEFEVAKSGFNLNTLEQIQKQNEGSKLFLLVGPDSFLKIGSWCKFRSILEKATIVSGYSDEKQQIEMKKLAFSLRFRPILLKTILKPINSTKIRIKIAQGLSVSSSLNFKVQSYVSKHKLYCKQGALVAECENACRNFVSNSRFMHCVAVSKMAAKLAEKHGENVHEATIAGLLHDIVKEQKPAFLLELLQMKTSFKLSEFEKSAPAVWHAPAGAIYCEKVLGIESRQILSAIASHTAGKANMTNFEKIIYIADNVSLDRKAFSARIGRKLAFKNLDRALLFQVKNHLQASFKKNLVLLDDSMKCYNQLVLAKTS